MAEKKTAQDAAQSALETLAAENKSAAAAVQSDPAAALFTAEAPVTTRAAVTSFAAAPPAVYSTASVTDRAAAEEALRTTQYNQSQSVTDALLALENWDAARPTDYVSQYRSEIDGLLDAVLHREKFTYDFSADPVYRQYAAQYAHGARLAGTDAAANAAALTGGYGSSYAASASSQAYQEQMNRLNAVIPALYAQALESYNDEGEAMNDRLDALNAQEKAAYGVYQDALSRYNDQRDFLRDAYNDAYEKDYGAYQDYLDQLGGLRDYYAKQEQQAAANELAQKEYELAVLKYEQSRAAAGGSAGNSSGGGSGTGGSADTGGGAEDTEEESIPVNAADVAQKAVANSGYGNANRVLNNTIVPYEVAKMAAAGKSTTAIRANMMASQKYTAQQIRTILSKL